MTITASEFKAKCLSLMEHVRKSGESIPITKRGVEVARLGPPKSKEKPWQRLKGSAQAVGDIVPPLVGDGDVDACTGHARKQRAKATRLRQDRRRSSAVLIRRALGLWY